MSKTSGSIISLDLTSKGYGAFELQEVIRRFTQRGFNYVVGAILLLLLISFIADRPDPPLVRAPLKANRVSLDMLPPPPQADNAPPPPPPPPDIVYTGPAARAGTPVPVPDAMITPDMQDFASTKDISTASAEGGTGEGPGDLTALDVDQGPVKIEQKEEIPDIDEFIDVQVEPTIDQGELARRIRYPENARRAGIEGRVTVRVLVGKDGRPRPGKYRIDQSDSEMLDKAAVEAIMASVFTPALQNNQPVECWVSIPVVFRMR